MRIITRSIWPLAARLGLTTLKGHNSTGLPVARCAGLQSKEEMAAASGYEASGGGLNNALSRLRTLELISGRGDLRASDDLFLGAEDVA